MAFMADTQELKPGLVIFRRTDVQHRNWYCRVKLPNEDRYKTISLKTEDIAVAKDKAFDEDADLRFRVKHAIPVFSKTFAQVAQDFVDFQKLRSEAGEITHHRWRVMDSHVRSQLNRFVGTIQITQIGEDRWKAYPFWRQQNGKGRSGGKVSDGTIRDEMATFRSIMAYAASKHFIRENQVFKGRLPLSKVSREEFTPDEYRKLHSFARAWIKKGRADKNTWYRTMVYNFILVMTNTGMRPPEARNLLWRNISTQTDKHGRKFVRLSVRGKSKHRTLVAVSSVADYLERIREISKATGPDDPVFSTIEGKSSVTLYHDTIERLLTDSGLLLSASGRRRSTYCFRHTYATFRLTEGVDVYLLAKQMGTSVKMIEDHYGHVTAVKNADLILAGLPGWEPIAPVIE
ncbi:tyrosine-type recombinase/integrase [Nitrospirillum pindoramense]|uniref:Site-specific recombinase XerD n=1 Tax=Nitrospirillum amazonense TaxID=28077 RepID=A0A560GL27_9PROT|nr:site-specific integrase [Nitrospirillum amazonense]TWB34314.1 site-specific recombinase XerD [Nitrospirillum amazonense]